MPVKWKQTPRFKPAVILKKIDSCRTVNPEGGASFSGFELEDCPPALHSMLDFPRVAAEVDVSSLVWRGLAKVGVDLTPETFLAAVNKELDTRLATKQVPYCLLTALSVDARDVPQRMRVQGADIRIFAGSYPSRYKSRDALIARRRTPVPATPLNYCKAVVTVTAKSPSGATSKALRSLDLQRALWCLMGNSRMQIAFGSSASAPINVVRLGSQHTLHLATGEPATEGIWYEPAFAEAPIFRIENAATVRKNSLWALRRIAQSPYGDRLADSLIKFVRALDEREPNTAFLRLWAAVEALASPGIADYEKIVQRCSFIFRDGAFHRQLLEHLREYRNSSVHAGEESERARTHCFQLQLYFVNLLWFHVRNASFFGSLDEANSFLESPADRKTLERRAQLVKKALRFIA